MKLFSKKTGREMPEKIFEEDVIRAADIIAPAAIVITPNNLKIGERFAKSFFIFSYPRELTAAWLSPIINLDVPMDVSLYIDPIETGTILKKLRRSVTDVQSEIMEREDKGLIRDPALEIAFQDLEALRDRLQSAQERMFNVGIYLTIYSDNEKGLKDIENNLRSILESRLIYIKPALYQQKEGFISTSPYGMDRLMVHNKMNTEPLSSSFPFVSFDLSSNEGILYGINLHNSSLVLFDRFGMENANMCCFGVAGSGKSYALKLEILRYLMLGVDVIVLDPENEYKNLSESVGGSFINFSLASESHINPFDLPTPREDEKPEDVLRSNVINLVGLLRLMLGGLNPEEDAIIDRALTETYAAKDITPETDSLNWKNNIPLMQDFESILEGMDGGESLVRRVRKFTKGTYAQFFNHPTNVTMKDQFVTFGIRDMEDELRPLALFIIMRYIWNEVRSELKKRILVVDEAWWMMKNEDSASFLFGIVKRCRKYWLGVTTITQDVNDFMKSDYGKPIVTNSSLLLLMKQSTATIDVVQKTFNLTDYEKMALLESAVGEGIFFAGQKHVQLAIKSSYAEDQIITTNPEQVSEINKSRDSLQI
jgi:conjugal transfer ATP-binding protein TraC